MLQLPGSKDIELVYELRREVKSVQAEAEMLGLNSIDQLANRWDDKRLLRLFIQKPLANSALLRNNAEANSNHQ
ncbi:hypothetical protein [Coleofasciculus sp. G2-EDA-02]|uniref:hypothetical protein n=1 Tax=Coleofasciculus sp. G2-EDA-02 TaxID=3069529 RepID=UPI0032F5AC63